jgi:hypothetical protein
MYDK